MYRGQNPRFPIDFAGYRYNSAASAMQPVMNRRINCVIHTYSVMSSYHSISLSHSLSL